MRSRNVRLCSAIIAAGLAVLLAGCVDGDERPESSVLFPDVVPLPSDSGFDYQLGGGYEPASDVRIVVRDRTDPPLPGGYSICYLNGFQTQPGEADSWPADVLLRDAAGDPIVDPDWPDEVLLDISTAHGRQVVVERVSEWIVGCADAGFSAVEFDNLDSFTRSDGRISRDDALTVATGLATAAHGAGLAAGQKNAAEFSAHLRTVAEFDFAIAEECAAFDECAAYSDVYGEAVLDVEYTDNLRVSFERVCAHATTPRQTILRDRALRPAGDADHTFQACR